MRKPSLSSHTRKDRQGARSASPPPSRARLLAAIERAHPQPQCALLHRSPFELLVATVLSAQSTDVQINRLTPALFARFPDPASLAAAPLAEVEALIFSSGFFRAKARNIVALAAQLIDRHGGQVPADMAALTALPGVARKTANVVLGTAFGRQEGVVVDTHVARLAGRLGLTAHTDPVKIERDLMAQVPRRRWTRLSLQLIDHGRQSCLARRPRCGDCQLAHVCPSRQHTPTAPASPPGRRSAGKN